jgi:APA family basic amino acid/polyamine antiporter
LNPAGDSDTVQDGRSLIRGIGLGSATALNMIDMIGVGPFITIPLIIAAMGGPQAILGWVVGAGLVICDGLVWAELGASMPGSGGSYGYLRNMYNPERAGKFVAFLFIWQLSFSAPLSIASGCVGLSQYITYVFPSLSTTLVQSRGQIVLPLAGAVHAEINFSYSTFVAMGVCLLATALLYRQITVIARVTKFLWIGVLITVAWILFAGITHFNAQRAFSFPPGAFSLSANFFQGLGAGMLIAVYDYWGYYNVCFIGGEVKNPSRTIPRAILFSILFVAIIYITMNISILGVIPWQELSGTLNTGSHGYVISIFMERLYGSGAAIVVTVLIMWTAFASVFSLLLGYSRVPYAAAVDGEYFSQFSRLHPQYRFPHISLLSLSVVALLFCAFKLSDIIAALVVIRIMIQFLAQTAGLIMLRARRPDFPRPFRMWLYPLPAIASFCGFIYILIMRKNFLVEIRYGVLIVVLGTLVYLTRAWRLHQWPFCHEPKNDSLPT